MDITSLQTLKVRNEGSVYFIQIYRPEANNTINRQLILEFTEVLKLCEQQASVVVVEGLPEVFCFGADFNALSQSVSSGEAEESVVGVLYDTWFKLATGPYISVAHVRGQVNAGGVGFVAACDMVIADDTAVFSLSELLFGLYPACVIPFLARRIGLQKANFFTVSTQTINSEQAHQWGLVDLPAADSKVMLSRQLLRLRRLGKASVAHYKNYILGLDNSLQNARASALHNNEQMHLIPGVVEGITRYVQTKKFPWEN